MYFANASLDVPYSNYQKFQARTGVVGKAEMERWKYLSLAYYMTEESDDPDNPNGIVENKLQW